MKKKILETSNATKTSRNETGNDERTVLEGVRDLFVQIVFKVDGVVDVAPRVVAVAEEESLVAVSGVL